LVLDVLRDLILYLQVKLGFLPLLSQLPLQHSALYKQATPVTQPVEGDVVGDGFEPVGLEVVGGFPFILHEAHQHTFPPVPQPLFEFST
jgi:hypothetical protein